MVVGKHCSGLNLVIVRVSSRHTTLQPKVSTEVMTRGQLDVPSHTPDNDVCLNKRLSSTYSASS